MLFHMKDRHVQSFWKTISTSRDIARRCRPPEDELFTPAGFSEERAEATSYSTTVIGASTLPCFFKKIAVALLIALVFVGLCLFAAPSARSQDPNLAR